MKLLFLGDSLIEYFDWQGRFPGHRVFNHGVAGESVEGLLSRVMRVEDLCAQADKIFIMSGINNAAMGDFGFAGFYKVIIEKLRAVYPDAEIFISSLLPVIADFIDDNEIKDINASLQQLASGTDVKYMDLYSKFTDADGRPIQEYIEYDGIHLSSAGYNVWSGRVEEALYV